jgi:hypothetical protein
MSAKQRTEQEFGPALADRLVGVIAGGRHKLNLSGADIDWGASLVWTFGQVAPVTSDAQHDAYASEVTKILDDAGAPLSKEATAVFMRTQNGMRAIALSTRMLEWKRGH